MRGKKKKKKKMEEFFVTIRNVDDKEDQGYKFKVKIGMQVNKLRKMLIKKIKYKGNPDEIWITIKLKKNASFLMNDHEVNDWFKKYECYYKIIE